MECHEISLEVHEIPGNIVEFHGMPWGSLKYHAVPWNAIMCMKDTDLLIENNVQPILDFQKKLERKANVESSSANLLLLRTTAS